MPADVGVFVGAHHHGHGVPADIGVDLISRSALPGHLGCWSAGMVSSAGRSGDPTFHIVKHNFTIRNCG